MKAGPFKTRKEAVAAGLRLFARQAAYRALRAQGLTIDSPVDVPPAGFCIEHGHALLHSERDFDALEAERGLPVWRH